MYIFLIKGEGENVGQSNTFQSHVIIAKGVDEVLKLAKAHALDEGKDAWNEKGIEKLGVYTGEKKMSYIVVSHLVYES